MAETTVLQDADGNYYVFAIEAPAAAQTAEGTCDLTAEAVEPARVPEDRRNEIGSSLGLDVVSGFSHNPIPGFDIIIQKKPGGRPTCPIWAPSARCWGRFSFGGSAGPPSPR